jgi:hypothetical protein
MENPFYRFTFPTSSKCSVFLIISKINGEKNAIDNSVLRETTPQSSVFYTLESVALGFLHILKQTIDLSNF